MTVNNSKRNQVHLAMFAKYWEAGKVKTRLARTIGSNASRDVHLLFVRFLLQKFETFGDLRTLVGSPAENHDDFLQILPDSWQLQLQVQGDLGARMSHFFCANQQAGQSNILIGSDTPDLRTKFLDLSVELLENNDLVLGPSKDGGYYLIAMKNHWPQIFENITWSSPSVLSQTIEIARQNAISYALLPELNDVDELDDLKQLIENLESVDDRYSQNLFNSLAALELNLVR